MTKICFIVNYNVYYMPSEGFESCPLCNRQFNEKKTGHDAVEFIKYVKRKV